MNKEIRPISDAHIHAYVDDELNQKRREVVEDYIVTLPIKCTQVRAYRKINELMRQSFSVDQIPYKHRKKVSGASEATSKFRLVRKQKTVMVIGVIIGVVLGWFVTNTLFDDANHSLQFTDQYKIKSNQTANRDILNIVE